jgi:hypothetical protein
VYVPVTPNILVPVLIFPAVMFESIALVTPFTVTLASSYPVSGCITCWLVVGVHVLVWSGLSGSTLPVTPKIVTPALIFDCIIFASILDVTALTVAFVIAFLPVVGVITCWLVLGVIFISSPVTPSKVPVTPNNVTSFFRLPGVRYVCFSASISVRFSFNVDLYTSYSSSLPVVNGVALLITSYKKFFATLS